MKPAKMVKMAPSLSSVGTYSARLESKHIVMLAMDTDKNMKLQLTLQFSNMTVATLKANLLLYGCIHVYYEIVNSFYSDPVYVFIYVGSYS